MADPAPLVQIARTSFIKPLKPTKPHILYLSSSDHILQYARPNRTILFYKTETDPVAAANSFKRSLSTVLVAFYPLAGRLIEDVDGRLALDCNDEGVEFVEAHCDLSLSEIEADGYQIHKYFRDLTRLDDREYCDHLEDPLVSIQVTSFMGGLSVGIVISHVASDGYSFWHFVRSLGEICRGEKISIPPLHMRTILRPENFLLNRVHGVDDEIGKAVINAPYSGALGNSDGRKFELMLLAPEHLHQRILHVTRDMLDILKSVCYQDTKGPVSSFEALSAYCWKRLTRAQGLDDDVRVDYRVPLDIRLRIIPPLTLSYFGNAVVGVSIPTTAGELKRESLGATADRIREGVKEGDDSYIKKAVRAREKMDLRKLVHASVVLCNIRNASKFPVHGASDFGWGEPDAVRPPWEWREGEITWYPGKEEGSIDVILGLSSFTVGRFFSAELQALDPLGHYLF